TTVRLYLFSSRSRHTSFSRDWSSDVCSSNLGVGSSIVRRRKCAQVTAAGPVWETAAFSRVELPAGPSCNLERSSASSAETKQRTDRKSVVYGKSVGIIAPHEMT